MDNSSRLQQFGAALPLLSDGQSSKMCLASVQERDVFMSRDAGQRRYLLITIYQYLIQYIHTYLIFKPSKLITDELSTGRYNWYIFMYVIRSLFILRVLCILCFMFVRSKSCPSLVFVSTRMYIVYVPSKARIHVHSLYMYIYMYIRTYVNLFTTHQVRIYM